MHPQPICQTLKPTSPHTATYVDQVQVTQYVHMPTVSTYGHLKQSHTPIFPPSITKVKPVSNLSRHQDRSTANYYPQLHTMQPGLAPPSLHTCPSTIQRFWPAHHRATQTPLHCHSQPYATHSLTLMYMKVSLRFHQLLRDHVTQEVCTWTLVLHKESAQD